MFFFSFLCKYLQCSVLLFWQFSKMPIFKRLWYKERVLLSTSPWSHTLRQLRAFIWGTEGNSTLRVIGIIKVVASCRIHTCKEATLCSQWNHQSSDLELSNLHNKRKNLYFKSSRILMPLEVETHSVPHLKALISTEGVLNRGSTFTFCNNLLRISILDGWTTLTWA